jgi:PAS domain S-box-containing protein
MMIGPQLRESVGNPMPLAEVDEHYVQLSREIDALEAEVPNSQARRHIADVRRRIDTLYETLRENRQLLETVLENSAANIYAKRSDGRYIYLNHEMEVTHDVTREQALGKTDLELFPREMAEQNRTNDLAAMMTGKLTEVEERVMGPSGERLFLAKKVPLISSDGRVEGMCGISTDITDLRRTELALREAVISLEGERDNKLMNIEAVTASIAHEVRQPLAAIAMNGEAALQFLEGVPLDIDRVRAILNQMMGDCHRVSDVFDTIRALFRRVDQKREPTVVNEIVLDVLQSMREMLTDHGVTAQTELAPELQRVDGHRNQLRQVIFNLINNAIESMDNTMDRSRVLRVMTTSHVPDAIIVAVEDSGPGISPTRLETIFDPFVTTKPDGMGLGLAICRMIVERHGGKLSALSDGRNGARFQLVLPVRLTDSRGSEVTD